MKILGKISHPYQIILGLFLMAWVSFPAWAADLSITDSRLGVHGETTRFVLDLNKSVEYRIFSLPDPNRIVIDLPRANWKIDTSTKNKKAGLIKTYRYGLFNENTFRIVMDLEGPALIKKTFILPPSGPFQYRLVVDVEKTTTASFAEQSRRTMNEKTATKKTDKAKQQITAPPAENKKPVIVIDPGHGGVDPGAVANRNVYEKNIVLAAAKQLQKSLQQTKKYEVILTRNNDIFVQLEDRVYKARAANADLFISLHADSHPDDEKIQGASVYTLSENASDAESARLAAQENKADLIAGVNLTSEPDEVTNILIDLAQRETMNMSSKFANFMVDELAKTTKLLRNTHRFAGFVVLKAPDVPSVLVELGYLSNKNDQKKLRQTKYRAELIKAISTSVDQYFEWRAHLNEP